MEILLTVFILFLLCLNYILYSKWVRTIDELVEERHEKWKWKTIARLSGYREEE